MSTIWENTDGCAEIYICASALYLISVISQCYSVIIDWFISAYGHGKEVVDELNAVDKLYIYIYQLMFNVQIPVSNRFGLQIQIHTINQNNYVSLVKIFQHHLTKEHCKNGIFDQGKNNKWFMEIKWKCRQYYVQDNADVAHKDVRMFCNTNQFPVMPFCGPHSITLSRLDRKSERG